MGSRGGRRRPERWCVQPLTPLMEGPDLERQDHELVGYKKEISPWEVIREWFRVQRNIPHLGSTGSGNGGFSFIMPLKPKRQDLRLLLGVLGCPLAPIPLPTSTFSNNLHHHLHSPHIIKHIPIENSRAHYIIQQYLAATGCLKHQQHNGTKMIPKTNMYTTGVVKMICCETEISSGSGKGAMKTIGTTRSSGENGCFELWQMTPGMWSLELVLGNNDGGHNNKLIAGSDGHIVWRHTPRLGTHAAKGPLRPLRRIIQGLDPKSTARLFGEAQCLGEKRIGEEECFVLKVTADKAALKERNEGAAEVIRHILYGYFSQKTGHLIYLEDSHLTRVSADAAAPTAADATSVNNFSTEEEAAVYWETTIGSSIGDYREVDGVLIAHQGRTIATVFRFGESSLQHSRTRMEEIWRIDDVVFNVPGLSLDSFIPPADIFHSSTGTP